MGQTCCFCSMIFMSLWVNFKEFHCEWMIWLQTYLSTCYPNDNWKHLHQTCVCPVFQFGLIPRRYGGERRCWRWGRRRRWRRSHRAAGAADARKCCHRWGRDWLSFLSCQTVISSTGDVRDLLKTISVVTYFIFQHDNQWHLQLGMSQFCTKPSAMVLCKTVASPGGDTKVHIKMAVDSWM